MVGGERVAASQGSAARRGVLRDETRIKVLVVSRGVGVGGVGEMLT